jgi:hypothetical protein
MENNFPKLIYMTVLHVSPSRVLLSRMLSIRAADQPDTISTELLDLCTGDSGSSAQSEGVTGAKSRTLVHVLWDRKELDSYRLKMVMASWCAVRVGKVSSQGKCLSPSGSYIRI